MMVKAGKGTASLAEDAFSEEDNSEPTLDRAIQAQIGDHLRAMYDDLMNQPVPDRFAELLGRLEGLGGKEQER